jgi:hypothetical protein
MNSKQTVTVQLCENTLPKKERYNSVSSKKIVSFFFLSASDFRGNLQIPVQLPWIQVNMVWFYEHGIPFT